MVMLKKRKEKGEHGENQIFFFRNETELQEKKEQRKIGIEETQGTKLTYLFPCNLKQNPTTHEINLLFQGRQQHLQQRMNPNSTA